MWRIEGSEVNAHWYDWLTVVYDWQRTFLIDGCCYDFGQKHINDSIQSNDLFNRQSNSDHVRKTVTRSHSYGKTCCDTTVRSNIVAQHCLLVSIFLKSRVVIVCKQIHGKGPRTRFLLTLSVTSLKIKFIHSFLTLGSEGTYMPSFSTTWHCTACCCLQSIFIVWFLLRPAHSPLS